MSLLEKIKAQVVPLVIKKDGTVSTGFGSRIEPRVILDSSNWKTLEEGIKSLEAAILAKGSEIAELKANVLELQSLYVIRTPWIDPQDEITELKEKHAREIERIKRNHGCAREQGATQFCHEALDAHKEADAMRAALAAKDAEIERLKKDADAALGRAVRKMPAWTFIYRNSVGWFSGTEMSHGTRTYGPKADTPEAALEAAGLMEVDK